MLHLSPICRGRELEDGFLVNLICSYSFLKSLPSTAGRWS